MSKGKKNNVKTRAGADEFLTSGDNPIMTKIEGCLRRLTITFEERIFAKSGKAPTYVRR